jgi:phosphatidylglycerophosphatase C
MDHRPVVVAVDLDGTITDRDCVTRYLLFELGWSRLLRLVLRSAKPLLVGLMRTDRDAVKLVLSSWLGGKERRDLEMSGRRFATTRIGNWLREETIQRLEAHRMAGGRIVIVSASYDHYVSVVAEMIRAEVALATRLEFIDDVATGRLAGPNCRGDEKVRRLRGWLSENFPEPSQVHVVAYGDSSGDDALLGFASEGTRVARRSLWVR